MLVCYGSIVDLVDVAVAHHEVLAATIDLHRITIACGMVAAKSTFTLDRTAYPAQLAVRYGQILCCAAADAVRAAILQTEVVESCAACCQYDVSLGQKLDRREALGRVALRRAEIYVFVATIVVVELQIALQVAVRCEGLAGLDVECRAILLVDHHHLEGVLLAMVEYQCADIIGQLTIVHIYILSLGLHPFAHLCGIVGRTIDTGLIALAIGRVCHTSSGL